MSHAITIVHVWRFYLCWRLTDAGYSELSAAVAFDVQKGPELSVTLVKVIVAIGCDFWRDEPSQWRPIDK